MKRSGNAFGSQSLRVNVRNMRAAGLEGLRGVPLKGVILGMYRVLGLGQGLGLKVNTWREQLRKW